MSRTQTFETTLWRRPVGTWSGRDGERGGMGVQWGPDRAPDKAIMSFTKIEVKNCLLWLRCNHVTSMYIHTEPRE